MTKRAYIGADVFDGTSLWKGKAVVLEDAFLRGIVDTDQVPTGCQIMRLEGGTLLPGFVDVQVNGGGGVLFNDATSVQGLRTIAGAHASTGTRAFLPTLITDTPDKTRVAVDVVETAIAQDIPGIVGLHLEGPHLSVARKGAHDDALIRPMTEDDEAHLLDAADRLPNLMVTVAPENVSNAQITRLSDAGVIVSLGHTDCTFEVAQAAFSAGARCVTHLFNAMSQMGSRAPGLVGAALTSQRISAGLIADNIHVHAATMQTALAAKPAGAGIFLVTDAMSTVGSDITEFHLNGRKVLRREGRLTLEDGTLAGADLEMTTALKVVMNEVGVDPAKVLAMATSVPAAVLRRPRGFGKFQAGQPWHGIYLDKNYGYQPDAF